MKKVVFLDKDGTLVDDVPYNTDPQRVVLCPGVYEGLALLRDAGFAFVVVSNQDGIARGYLTEAALRELITYMTALFASLGVPMLGFYYCPHPALLPDAPFDMGCPCRKPRPGMLLQAASEHGINLSCSWMIGDILNDVEAGHRSGCRAAFIDKGHETEWLFNQWRVPDLWARNFFEAAQQIVEATSKVGRLVS